MNKLPRYAPEVRERVVRMVLGSAPNETVTQSHCDMPPEGSPKGVQRHGRKTLTSWASQPVRRAPGTITARRSPSPR